MKKPPLFQKFNRLWDNPTSGTVAVTVGAGCAWTAVSNHGFVSVTGGASGSGSGTVSYSVATNSIVSQRIGTMTIARHTFTVTQAAASAPFTDDPLVPGTTPIKATHFTELRERIDAQLARFGQSAHAYSNAIVVGGTMRAVDLTEMYAAVNAALATASPPQSTIAEPTLTPTIDRRDRVSHRQSAGRGVGASGVALAGRG